MYLQKLRRSYLLKHVSLFLAITMFVELFLPSVAYALTSGPVQPEFSSFEPVATTNMVNPFSGDFTYNLPVLNVPGPNGGGYALSLSYHSGVSPEEESSWVGLGWTLNPGAINRNKAGFPDDFNGKTVNYVNDMPDNVTVSVGLDANIDFFTGFFGVSASRAVRFNNFKGFGAVNNVGLSIVSGLVSVGYSSDSDGKSSWSADINPAGIFAQKSKNAKKKAKKAAEKAAKDEATVNKDSKSTDDQKAAAAAKTKEAEKAKETAGKKSDDAAQFLGPLGGIGSTYTSYIFGDDFRPLSVSEYTGVSGSAALNIGGTVSPLEISIRGGIFGNATVQTNKTRDRNAYGFLYSSGAYGNGNGDGEMDYSLEKENIYTKRSLFLPTPFAAPDIFAVTGEGMAGTFKFRSKKTGFFRPPQASSSSILFNLNIEPQLGLNNGCGARLGVGAQNLDVKAWDVENAGNIKFDGSGDEGYYLSYLGDLAKNTRYVADEDDNGKPYRVNLQEDGINSVKAQITGFSNTENNTTERTKRSSYLGYHTNQQLKDNMSANTANNRYAFDKSESTQTLKASTILDDQYKDLVSEVVSVNEDGNQYVFGLPVYAKEEKHMSYRMPTRDGCFVKNKIIYPTDLSFGKTGQTVNDPYGTTYLLTQITTPDYIDKTMDGPTSDDFGGWTKFNYVKTYGDASTAGEWYKWRFPYDGLNYDPGSLSDPRDDMGSYMSGKKEVYYLESIETKTHKAIFYISDRADGFAAIEDDEMAARRPIIPGTSANALKRLDKIVLYAKDPENTGQLQTDKPINVIHFEYYDSDKELCKGIPNAESGRGKLTLKKVWFEYEGIVNAKIAPYEFKYEYKKIQSSSGTFDPKSNFRANGNVYTKYNGIIDEFGKVDNSGNSILNENPGYNANSTDAWGNWAYDGVNRNSVSRPWVYQGNMPENNSFDPAAWNLKNIILPSGGQILVQYESHDYAWVQNQPAAAMVSLTDFNDAGCVVNLADLGLEKPEGMSNDDYKHMLDDYVSYLNDYFGGRINEGYVDGNLRSAGERKMYFKLLYSLEDNKAPSVNSCGGEYINGYVKLAPTDGATVKGVAPGYTLEIKFDPQNGDYTPRKLCQDFYGKNRMSLVNGACSDPTPDMFKNTSDIPAMILGLFGKFFDDFEGKRTSSCPTISPNNSYIRLPLPHGKKGGGVRVKRLMMYDPGWDEGEEVLFGTEYIYETKDGRSSGVATNEPPAAREENGVVNFMNAMAPQTDFQKLTAGEDIDKYEGPIGESLLPGASIGYSRVIAKNIHDGQSSNGFTIHEFYTTVDYPSVRMQATPIDNSKSFFSYIPAILVNVNIDNRWAAQGYSFMTNDMHGKTKRVASFGGNYQTGVNESLYQMNSEESYEYYPVGSKVPVLEADGIIRQKSLGKEEEVAIEGRSVEDVTINGSLEINFSGGIFLTIVIPFFHAIPYLNTIERKMRTNTTTRITNYPSILKRTVTKADGITHVEENRLFDYATGKPIATVSNDEFYNVNANGGVLKGTYTNYNLPAHYLYDDLKGKYQNQDLKLNNGNEIYIAFLGNNETTIVFDNADAVKLKVGDLLKVGTDYAFVNSINGTVVEALKHTGFSSSSTDASVRIEVVQSSYLNRYSVPLANMTLYEKDDLYSSNDVSTPFAPISASQKKLSDFSKVIAMSTNVYSRDWTMSDYLKNDYKIASGTIPYLSGESNNLRLKTKYVYKDKVVNSTDGNKVYSSGYIAGPVTGFNYLSLPSDNDAHWIKGSVVNYYSPNGDPLEEVDVLGIPSAAKYAHNDNVVALVASNAKYSGVLFESFEDKYGAEVLSSASIAHSGKKYIDLIQGAIYNSGGLTSGTLLVDGVMKNGISVRFWTRGDFITSDQLDVRLVTKTNPKTMSGSTTLVTRSGEWSLFEARFGDPTILSILNPTPFSIGEEFYPAIVNQSPNTIQIDDIRVQPLESKMSCYVYDNKNLRLLASFDDQHFGLYYVYNAEGKLIRKMVETERGTKTITETLYNTPLRTRQ